MNKRFILTLTSLLALVIQVSAEDKFTIKDFAIQAGETIDVNIELENDASYTAFQFDLYLPEGISLKEDKNGCVFKKNDDRIPQKTDISIGKQKDGSYSIVATPWDLNKDIIGNSGSVVTITVTADKDMKAGDLTGYFRKIKLANANDANIRATYDEMSFPISVASLPLGDANVSGNVDATDIVDIVNYLMGKPSSTGAFNEDLADANEDGVVDTADIVSIVNIIMNK